MKKTIKTLLAGLLIVPALVLGVSLATPFVQDASALGIQDGANAAQGDNTSSSLFGDSGIFKTITNTALFIIGALSVIMLIYGGIRYTVSMGDAKNVEAAKNTIMYAIVGIVVALLAYAIVNFVLGALITTA